MCVHAGNGVTHIWGTSPESIDIAEDRDRWMALLSKLSIRQPAGGSARSEGEALTKARSLGYPVMIRPSYVLGGRAMEILYDDDDLKRYVCVCLCMRLVECMRAKQVCTERCLLSKV